MFRYTVLLAGLATVACGSGRDPVPSSGRQLDLLLVVDETGSSLALQQALAPHMGTLLDRLASSPGGMPDLQIGVISTDVGAGTWNFGDCTPGGKRGQLQARAACGLGSDRWIRAQGRRDEVAATAACLVNLGGQGCGYEQPLAALQMALEDTSGFNAGFFRPSADLAVVFLVDEDDCSADPASDVYTADVPGDGRKLRCAREGHLCQGARLPSSELSAPLSSCAAADGSAGATTRLTTVGQALAQVRAKKPTYRTIVAGVIGWPLDPTSASYRLAAWETGNAQRELHLAPVCQGGGGAATPALRLKAFIDSFGAAGLVESVCTPDPAATMGRIGRHIADRLHTR